jgi:hypothetical protein
MNFARLDQILIQVSILNSNLDRGRPRGSSSLDGAVSAGLMIWTIGSNLDWTLQIWEYPFGLKFYYTPLDLDPTVEIKSGELT